MPTRFTEEDLALMRVLSSQGWTTEYWETLPESEQIEWLAYDEVKQQNVQNVIKALQKKNAKGHSGWTPEAAAILLPKMAE